MSYTATAETPESIKAYQSDTSLDIHWPSVFVLPAWLRTWREVFGTGREILLTAIKNDGEVAGIAPLMKEGDTASFLGSTDVCDYMDFITRPGMEKEFFRSLIEDLKKNGIRKLDLAHVRPDSAVITHLKPEAEKGGYKVIITPEEISLETSLPGSWEDYLAGLSGKQRHEVRRKLRRLNEAGDIDYSFKDMPVKETMDLFLGMFTESRQDKAEFLTDEMESFFRLLAQNMSEEGLLKFGVLRLGNKAVACIMCFDYNGCFYLYNSGYDPDYNYLSAGLLSKALAIKESISEGKKKFDFLKGAEPYKYHLGGKEVTLSRCVIDLI